MKGDFSRLSFRPRRGYARVLQQQGRPTIDADWNEQVAILLHRLETLTGDLTGGVGTRSGAPFNVAGFEIAAIAGEEKNFKIGLGRYYVDGLCCECDHNTSYLDQPLLAPESKLHLDGVSLVYLDVWEAVVGPIDDPSVLEPALNGLDTSLRTRVVWQVRTHRLSHHHDANAPDFAAMRQESHELTGGWRTHPRGLLRARLGGPGRRAAGAATGAKEGGRFRGPENLLYRVEVHEGGPAGQATFKWSRENGAPLLALVGPIEGKSAHVAPAARHAATQLAPGTWLEPSDSLDRALGRSRPMAQVANVDGASGRIDLSEAPEGALGQGMALRRWDQRSHPGAHESEAAGPSGILIVEGEHEAHWLDLEDGIEIQFQAEHGRAHHYRTGDYWLIPARTSDGGVLLRSLAPQEPDGVEHRYAPLALIAPRLGAVICDLRPSFQPLAALQDQVNALADGLEDLRGQIAALRDRR